MNPYQYRVSCNVCGGEGAATSRGLSAAWTVGGFVSHRDPRVCADILAAKESKREKMLQTPPPGGWAVPV